MNFFLLNFRATPWSDNFSLNQSETGPSSGGKSIFLPRFSQTFVCFEGARNCLLYAHAKESLPALKLGAPKLLVVTCARTGWVNKA